jgi:hypothetical protein
MLAINEALVILTILLVEGIRNIAKPPSWLGPYLVFAVAWVITYISLVGDMGWAIITARMALSQALPVAATAIVIYDAGFKPVKKLAAKSAKSLNR